MSDIRPPAVAGLFYPANAQRLRDTVESLLDDARTHEGRAHSPGPKALQVPHAGYIYSGSTAAQGFATLDPLREAITRVVLIGPSHRVPLRGLALPVATHFATPLGLVPLDEQGMVRVRALPHVVRSDVAHADEHSLEVQLPFLQCLLAEFSLLPLVVGRTNPDHVADVLDAVWGGPETLILTSSDLSHYLPYASAQHMDQGTVEQILRLEYPVAPDRACGASPLNGLLSCARKRGMKPRLIALRNSGDTAGDKARVVGYSAISFTEATHATP